jgi:hypothetical protein
MKMKLLNGNLAGNDKENADAFEAHFQNILDGDTPHVNIPAILKKIPKKRTMNPPNKERI